MKKLILTTAILFGSFLILTAFGQPYPIGEKLSIRSAVLDEERNLLVYTPLSYRFSDQSYPVLYLLDGETHFHHATGIVQFLSAQGLMPETIVVAIVNVDRTRDFSPTHIEKVPNTGGAEKFMRFISDELIPYVDGNYRTQTYRTLVGHSFGGEFAAYALLNRPDVFRAYIAISPYLMYDDNFLVKEAETKLKSKYPNGVKFYMTVGLEPGYIEALATFENIIEKKSPTGFEFKYVIMKDEDHGSIPHLSIYNGLGWIYAGWKMPAEKIKEGLAEIDNYYSDLSKKYGYEIKTPEAFINLLGYKYLGEKEFNKAIKIFKENVKRYPKSANVYDSLGEALENNQQYQEAKENYQKAVEIAALEKHPFLDVYAKNLMRMDEKLEEK